MASIDKPVFIDATVFMGMHARCEKLRWQSLMVMSRHFGSCVYMSLEQVGLCDDIVWGYPRHVQDDYYPFMDCLHSKMDIQRLAYSENDLILALDIMNNSGEERLASSQALVLAQVVNRDGILASHDPCWEKAEVSPECFLTFPALPGIEWEKLLQIGKSGLFDDEIDSLYDRSRCLVHE